MAIKKTLNIDINEICKELKIPKDAFLQFINHPETVFNQNSFVSNSTIIEVIDSFNKSYKMNNKKAKTTKKYYQNFLMRFKKYILERDQSLGIDKLNEEVLEDFLSRCRSRSGSNISTGTKNTYQAIVRALLRFAYDNDYINRDIRKRFEKASGKLIPKYLQDNQVEKVLEFSIRRTYGYLWRTIIFFLIGTGCRVSEVVKIKIQDLDLNNNYIYVVGKGNKERYIPIFPEVKKVVIKYLDSTGVKDKNRNASGYLFTREFGLKREKPISVRSVQYQTQNILKELGLEEQFSVHSFRHTFAVNCLKSNMRLDVLSQILGHDDPKTTSIYTQLLPSDLRSEVMKNYPFPFENLLFDIFGMKVEKNENFRE